MPKVLQPISCIIPTRWYIDAVRKLMIEGLPFGGVLREFSILAAMTALLIAAALRKFNDKLEGRPTARNACRLPPEGRSRNGF